MVRPREHRVADLDMDADVTRRARFSLYGAAATGCGLATAVVLGVPDLAAALVFLWFLLPLLSLTPLALLAFFEGPVVLTESGLRRRRGDIAWSEVHEAHCAPPYLVLATTRGKVRVFGGGKKEIMQLISEWNWSRLRTERTELGLGYREGPRVSAAKVRVEEDAEVVSRVGQHERAADSQVVDGGSGSGSGSGSRSSGPATSSRPRGRGPRQRT
jgi:hypothetical protein